MNGFIRHECKFNDSPSLSPFLWQVVVSYFKLIDIVGEVRGVIFLPAKSAVHHIYLKRGSNDILFTQ